jgi:hypothetical protein
MARPASHFFRRGVSQSDCGAMSWRIERDESFELARVDQDISADAAIDFQHAGGMRRRERP